MKKFNTYQKNGFTLAAACGLIGITYGVFADTAGLSLLQALALSIFTFLTPLGRFGEPFGDQLGTRKH